MTHNKCQHRRVNSGVYLSKLQVNFFLFYIHLFLSLWGMGEGVRPMLILKYIHRFSDTPPSKKQISVLFLLSVIVLHDSPPTECGGNTGVSLSILGHKRHSGFLLAVLLGSLAAGEANSHTVMTKASKGEVHVEGAMAPCPQPGTILELNPPAPSDDCSPG